MAIGEIRAIDRSCRSYRPGHQVHWIQAKHLWTSGLNADLGRRSWLHSRPFNGQV